MQTQRLLFCVAVAGLLVTGGCGGSNRPQLAPVSGKILNGGEPVEGAQVTFYPTFDAPRNAIGTTNAEGEFQLTTFDTNDGAMPGEYIVTVYKPEQQAEQTEEMDPLNPGQAYDEAMQKATKLRSGEQMVKTTLPEKFGNKETSSIRRTVAAEGPNDFTIDLAQEQ